MLSGEASFLPWIANQLRRKQFVLSDKANRPASRRKMPGEQASVLGNDARFLSAQQSLLPGRAFLPLHEGLVPRAGGPMPRAQPDLLPPIASMPPATASVLLAIAFRSVADEICHER